MYSCTHSKYRRACLSLCLPLISFLRGRSRRAWRTLPRHSPEFAAAASDGRTNGGPWMAQSEQTVVRMLLDSCTMGLRSDY